VLLQYLLDLLDLLVIIIRMEELGGYEARQGQRFFECRPLKTLGQLEYLQSRYRQAYIRRVCYLRDLPAHVVNQYLHNLPWGPI